MIEKVTAYIEKHHMIEAKDHIITGISGGADSVCLFLILRKLSDRMGFSMSAVHIEHGMRGRESLLDQAFVKKLCETYGVKLTCYPYRIRELAEKEGISLEEAGRIARYEAFRREAGEIRKETGKNGGIVKVAVAHHGNDNAETLLFHLCRGTGIDGLSGIHPVRGNIIRPLLGVTRQEIEAFLAREHQDYCTDATNADINYTRNRIRGEVIPSLEKVNSRAVNHMNQIAETMAELSDFIKEQAGKVLDEHMCYEGEHSVSCRTEAFFECPKAIQGAIALELLKRAAGLGRDISREHVNQVVDLSMGQVGRRYCMPYGLTAEKTYGGIRIHDKCTGLPEYNIFGTVPARVLKPGNGCCIDTPFGSFSCKIFEKSQKDENFPRNQCTKWFDYDKISDMFCFRIRQPGDYFYINAGGHRQKLKEYFINEKVPKAMRDQVVLMAEGHHIIWAAGYRISEYYKITGDTKRIIEVQYMEERT